MSNSKSPLHSFTEPELWGFTYQFTHQTMALALKV